MYFSLKQPITINSWNKCVAVVENIVLENFRYLGYLKTCLEDGALYENCLKILLC
jgi:hypothetical protein